MAKKVEAAPSATPETAPASSEAAPVGGLSLRDLGVADGIGPSELPRLDPQPAALIMVHPERWCVLEGEVVPLVGRLPIEGGVGNVKVIDPKLGTLSIAMAVAIKEKRGWKVLMPDIDGPGTSYLYQAAPGVFLTKWETAHAGSSIVSADRPGFVKWLRSLIDRRIIKPPAPYVLERLRARTQQDVLVLQDKVRTVPSAQVELDKKLADLEVIKRAIAGLPLQPVPKTPTSLGDVVDPDDRPDQE